MSIVIATMLLSYEITVKFKLTAQQFLDPNCCEAISKIAS